MEKLKDLKDLLIHEIHDLLSAEDQIVEALPLMIEKAGNPELKKALKEHLRITELQRKRLDQVNSLMGESEDDSDEENKKGVSSFLAKLFGNGVHKCKGIEGLITEGNKVMALDMNPEVMDAAIIACAQKIEHYEICGYGTARAYARELKLGNVAILLEETLNEEYAADGILSKLALGGLNEEAENASRDAGSDGAKKAPAKVAKSVGAKRFFGNDKAPIKAAPAKSEKPRGAKKSAPNRRQVTPKGATEGRANSSRGAAPRSQGGKASSQGDRRSTGGAGGGRSKSASTGRSPSSGGGRPQSASKGRSTGGNRGPSKGGGSRGHK